METVRAIFERQWLHGLLLLGLLTSAFYATSFEQVTAGEAFDVATIHWFWAAIAVAVVHQIYIWLCWRTELHAARVQVVESPVRVDEAGTRIVESRPQVVESHGQVIESRRNRLSYGWRGFKEGVGRRRWIVAAQRFMRSCQGASAGEPDRRSGKTS